MKIAVHGPVQSAISDYADIWVSQKNMAAIGQWSLSTY